MIPVKICGITNKEDALAAAQNGAAALGFIFYPHSPRCIAPEDACKIIKILPRKIARVGVFVNEKTEEVKRIARYCDLDFIQLHGDETVRYCHDFPPDKIIKAVNLQSEADFRKALQYNVSAILVDRRSRGLYGGTGKKANWDLALQIKNKKPLILSGGLNEDNVAEALAKVAPDALDVNSGVEMEPGKKDHNKIARIFGIVHSLDLKAGNFRPIFIKR